MQLFFAIENPVWLPKLKIYNWIKSNFDVSVISPKIFRSMDLLKSKKRIIIEEAIYFFFILPMIKRFITYNNCIVVCSTKHYFFLLLSKILSYFGINLRVFLYNFYLHKAAQLRIVQNILKYLITDKVFIIAQSKKEKRFFKELGPEGHIYFTPYGNGPFSFVPESKINLGNYIFSGGYSNRDYNLLMRCAARLKNIDFIVVCSKLNQITENIPPNVKLLRDLDLHEFYSLLAGCRMVVIPLIDDTGSSGQMVCLASMQYSKAIVYADFDIVTQYFNSDKAGIAYIPNNEESLFSSINSNYHDTEKLLAMGSYAKELYYKNYTSNKFESSVISYLDTFIHNS